jgi:copper homeostasis protein (lipoprotein)
VKKIIFLVFLAAFAFWGCAHRDAGHASKNSLDWAGTYVGTLPCADCEGMHTTLILNPDMTYTLSTRYVGKNDRVFEQRGVFSFSAEGSTLTLDAVGQGPSAYKVGENTLTQLDMQGQAITGDLAENYVLRKQIVTAPDLSGKCILDVRWRLVEILGKPLPASEGERAPYIHLNSKDGRFAGFGGCNAASGAYELKIGNRIRFTEMASTLMACPDMNVEQEFFEVLGMADNFACDGQTLFLHKARMAPLARFEAVH